MLNNTVTTKTNFHFPFVTNTAGRISSHGGDEALRGKIIQVLFTTPGERVNLPEFGCGLFNLVFEPNDPVLVAAMEFTVGEALNRWLADDLKIDGIQINSQAEQVTIAIAYTKKADQSKQAVRFYFS
jgi:phage baseplate assembly protein W